MILESFITCPHCGTAKSETMPTAPVSFSTPAPAAARRCGRNRVIVACSVPMARFHARRFRPSVRVRRAPLLATADSRRGKQYRAKPTRLAAKPAHEPARVVDSLDRRYCRPVRARPCSSGTLDHCAKLDGNGVHSQCKAVRPHPLPLHRPLLSRDDRAGRRPRFRPRPRRNLRLAGIGRRHSVWKRAPLVGDRACLGQIFLRQIIEHHLCLIDTIARASLAPSFFSNTWQIAGCALDNMAGYDHIRDDRVSIGLGLGRLVACRAVRHGLYVLETTKRTRRRR
jgi:hypothetical protein